MPELTLGEALWGFALVVCYGTVILVLIACTVAGFGKDKPEPVHVEPVRPLDDGGTLALDMWAAREDARRARSLRKKAELAAAFWREVQGPQPPALSPSEYASVQIQITDLIRESGCRA